MLNHLLRDAESLFQMRFNDGRVQDSPFICRGWSQNIRLPRFFSLIVKPLSLSLSLSPRRLPQFVLLGSQQEASGTSEASAATSLQDTATHQAYAFGNKTKWCHCHVREGFTGFPSSCNIQHWRARKGQRKSRASLLLLSKREGDQKRLVDCSWFICFAVTICSSAMPQCTSATPSSLRA